MTSEANRTYIINNFRIWSGADTKTVVDNDAANESADIEEEAAFAEIEEKLGIEMPRFYYRPQGLEFLKYDIDESVAIARVEYEYKTGMIITLLVDRQDENTASKTTVRTAPM